MEKMLFSDVVGLSDATQLALVELGFEHASAIQSQAIPHILAGRDVIGQAQTGTGKTAAFGLPMIEKLDTSERKIGAMVICPTRELVLQVATELKKFSRFKKPGVSVQPIYGGDPIVKQLKNLKAGTHVVVGTPGRLIDHLKRGTLDLSSLKMIVLDEADEMLNMGFRDDIEQILAEMPAERQTVLFSATMPKPIMDIAKRFQTNPVHIKTTTENLTNTSIEQIYFEIHADDRVATLADLITLHDLKLSLCFCNMKVQVDDLVNDLRAAGIRAEGIHGDLNQTQRNGVLTAFRNGEIPVLVATDVAARGIDVSDVDAVFNYELPFDSEYYVHRIGRTGRAGKTGKAFSFVTGRNEFRRLKNIEAFAKIRVVRHHPPSPHDLWDLHKANLLQKLQETLASGHLKKQEELVNEFLEQGFTPHLLAAVLLKQALPKPPNGPRVEQKPFVVEKKVVEHKPEKWAKSKFERPAKPSFHPATKAGKFEKTGKGKPSFDHKAAAPSSKKSHDKPKKKSDPRHKFAEFW